MEPSRPKQAILHVSVRETVLQLRDEILRIHGYDVTSTVDLSLVIPLFRKQDYALVLIDVEGEGRVPQAEELCEAIREEKRDQKIAFICNHRVSIHSDCPDEVIRADFDPKAMIRGVDKLLQPEAGAMA